MASATADHLRDARPIDGLLSAPYKVNGILHVPGFPALYGAPRHADGAEIEGAEERRDVEDRGGSYPSVPNQATAADVLGPGFELGLDQQHGLPQRGSGRKESLERDREGDKREVGDQQLGVER